jgi:hypothetical protein
VESRAGQRNKRQDPPTVPKLSTTAPSYRLRTAQRQQEVDTGSTATPGSKSPLHAQAPLPTTNQEDTKDGMDVEEATPSRPSSPVATTSSRNHGRGRGRARGSRSNGRGGLKSRPSYHSHQPNDTDEPTKTPPPTKPKSYAEAAGTKKWENKSERQRDMARAGNFFKPRPQPQKWHKLLLTWNPDKRTRLAGRKELVRMAWLSLAVYKINRLVKDISLRGMSVMELYVAGINLDAVEEALKKAAVPFNTNPQEKEPETPEIRQKTINRLGGMIYKHQIINLRTCILTGFDSLEAEVMNRAAQLETQFGPRSKQH